MRAGGSEIFSEKKKKNSGGRGVYSGAKSNSKQCTNFPICDSFDL